MFKDPLNTCRLSLLIVIAKFMGFVSIEFSKENKVPIEAHSKDPLQGKRALLYMVGYHMARFYGSVYYVSPFILALRIYAVKQVRMFAYDYAYYAAHYEDRSISPLGMVLDSVYDIFGVLCRNVDTLISIRDSLDESTDDVIRVVF